MFGAGVKGKCLVALAFVVLFHLFNRVSIEGVQWVEEPGALRTSPALKAWVLDPNEFSTHANRVSGTLKKGDNIGFL